ncbi:Ankyrin repeats (many copies) [compost metagenome]
MRRPAPALHPGKTVNPDIERCEAYRQFEEIHAAFRAGDIEALRAAVDDPACIPNGPMPPGIGACLEYAIYHSPLPLIRALLESGADPRPVDHAGFPPLIAALSCSLARPGATTRTDVIEVLRLLLDFGADPGQRGINDYTALHMAVSVRNLPAVELLLAAGADAACRTRIDECETPREMAEAMGLSDIGRLLVAHGG